MANDGFDPDEYSNAGGLPGMMQQQGVLRPGVGLGLHRPEAPGLGSSVYDLPGGVLLAGLLALHARQQSQAGNNEATPSEAQDPNFRQLVRVPQSAVDTSNQSDSLSGQRYGTLRGGEGAADASTAVSSPYPPMSPLPPIPFPDLPDWLKGAWTSLLRNSRGSGGGGRRSRRREDNDDWCTQRMYEEQKRCGDRNDDYTHRDYWAACMDRTKKRWDSCNSNGGRPSSMELPEWGPDQEDEWINESR
jgi:hypothetical protein